MSNKPELPERLVKIFTARAAIIESGAKPRNTGSMNCPICKIGQLNWSMASNKHIHAACSEPDCVRWME